MKPIGLGGGLAPQAMADSFQRIVMLLAAMMIMLAGCAAPGSVSQSDAGMLPVEFQVFDPLSNKPIPNFMCKMLDEKGNLLWEGKTNTEGVTATIYVPVGTTVSLFPVLNALERPVVPKR